MTSAEVFTLRRLLVHAPMPIGSTSLIKIVIWPPTPLEAQGMIESHCPGCTVRSAALDDYFASLFTGNNQTHIDAIRTLLNEKLSLLIAFDSSGHSKIESFLVGKASGGEWVGLRSSTANAANV